jgi:tRNA(Ser,Leu) C12 N-acetylase TAN1
MTDSEVDIEQQIDEWRSYLEQHRELAQEDIAELEDHLRGQIGELSANGLSPDEAFLVAIKRLGKQDAISREFALEHTDKLWKQLVLAGGAQPEKVLDIELLTVLALAVAAAVSLKIWDLTGLFPFETEDLFYVRNAPFFVMP